MREDGNFKINLYTNGDIIYNENRTTQERTSYLLPHVGEAGDPSMGKKIKQSMSHATHKRGLYLEFHLNVIDENSK